MTTTPEARIAGLLVPALSDAIENAVLECTDGQCPKGDQEREAVWHAAERAAAVIAALPDIAIVPRSLLTELVDPDPCWFDHNGGCQAHGYIGLEPGETCPVHDAKAILAAGGES